MSVLIWRLANLPKIAKLKFSGGRNVIAVVALPETPNKKPPTRFKWRIRQIIITLTKFSRYTVLATVVRSISRYRNGHGYNNYCSRTVIVTDKDTIMKITDIYIEHIIFENKDLKSSFACF